MADKLYLTQAQMKAELDKCLHCPTKPCQSACPVSCCPHDFIAKAKEGDYQGAVSSICGNNPMGQVCGLICPENFCMKACLRSKIDGAVRIPRLQATILHKYRKNLSRPSVVFNGIRIAVMGAGPAGLATAELLSNRGFEVTIFEKSDKIGGALNLIPDDRLPYEVIEKDGKYILSSDLVKIFYNMRIASPQVLLCNFDAVVVATGEPYSKSLDIQGENLLLFYTAYLSSLEKYKTKSKVAVIGGGRVAVDVALSAKKMGATEVDMFVRRRLSDMKISKSEYMELLDAQVDITTMTSPVEAEEKNGELFLHTVRNAFVDGKLTPQNDAKLIRGGYRYIIKAIGSRADKFEDDERIFYAGDCKNGGSTIVEALASGQQTALKVCSYFDNEG